MFRKPKIKDLFEMFPIPLTTIVRQTKSAENGKNDVDKKQILQQDPKRLDQWQHVIPRPDKVLSSYDSVCELHFLEDDILKFDETILTNCTVNKIKRERPRLKNEAIPCIFLNLPSYLSSIRKRRKPPLNRTEFVKIKKWKKILEPIAEETIHQDDEIVVVDVEDQIFERLKDNLSLICTPNEQWSGTFIPGKNDVIFVEWDETYTPTKKIVIHQDMSFKILFRKTEIFLPDTVTIIKSFQELEDLLGSINNMPMCTGTTVAR
ncbi:unnamed protein product [Psylliodes chrysocephalus]|uniref:THAP-type domain-containing protein n=1 Tax=Psylliodes chrysocephalus TaxID=3402493 RepID=A0A9P0D2N3_9CUCU|nr:unnamed protein product [Psylliodes chrysocephala]